MSALLLTFNEWKEQGFHVIKGQKAVAKNMDGTALFSRSQVEESYYSNEEDSDYGYEQDDFYSMVDPSIGP